MSTQNQVLEELFNAGVHLGHKTNRIHPKSRKYIYKVEAGTSIIDLSQTSDMLEQAKKYALQLGLQNKVLLVVVTKKIVAQIVTELCQKNNLPFITLKWPAGLITNFETISKNIKKLIDMKHAKEQGDWDKFVKHEQFKLAKELNRLEKFYGGLVSMQKLPDALFIVDIKKEKNAVSEARKKNIFTIAVTDTNSDPGQVDYAIPGNDDSENSILYLVNTIVDAYVEGKKSSEKQK